MEFERGVKILLLKNKPLMIGAIAVIALLIAGAIYFFVIDGSNGSDSEVETDTGSTAGAETDTGSDSEVETDTNTQNNGQEETDTNTSASIEDDGSAVLTEIGFDCQTTTIAAEAQVRIIDAQATAAEDPSLVAFAQLYASLINESEAADNEIFKCNHAEQQLDVIIASNTDADLHLMTIIQATCTIATNEGISAEGLEAYRQTFESSFEEDPYFVIGSNTYSAVGSAEAQQQLKALLQAEDIEYTPAATPEFTCDA